MTRLGRSTKAGKLRQLQETGARAAAVSVAVRLATDDDWEVRLRALEVLRDRGKIANVSVAVKGLQDSEDVVAATAIECIVEWRARRLADRVARLLDSPSELLRSYSAWALGKIGGPRHIPLLRHRFRVAKAEIEGSAAAEALFALTKERRYLMHLLAQLKSRDPEVRAFTSNSLAGAVDARNFAEVLCSFASALRRERNAVVVGVLRRDIEIALANALEVTRGTAHPLPRRPARILERRGGEPKVARLTRGQPAAKKVRT